MNYRDADVLAMARTIWGEARGEPREGQIAVAWVIRNRAENPGWWSRQRHRHRIRQLEGVPDDTIEAVCLEPNQFSCWWDTQSSKVRRRTTAQLGTLMDVARGVLNDEIPDPTGGADHYHTILRPGYALMWPPKWAQGRQGRTIGSHLFYAIGLTA